MKYNFLSSFQLEMGLKPANFEPIPKFKKSGIKKSHNFTQKPKIGRFLGHFLPSTFAAANGKGSQNL